MSGSLLNLRSQPPATVYAAFIEVAQHFGKAKARIELNTGCGPMHFAGSVVELETNAELQSFLKWSAARSYVQCGHAKLSFSDGQPHFVYGCQNGLHATIELVGTIVPSARITYTDIFANHFTLRSRTWSASQWRRRKPQHCNFASDRWPNSTRTSASCLSSSLEFHRRRTPNS